MLRLYRKNQLDGAEPEAKLKSFRAVSYSAQYTLERFIGRPTDYLGPKQPSAQARQSLIARLHDQSLLHDYRDHKTNPHEVFPLWSWFKALRPPDPEQIPKPADLADVVRRAFPPRMKLPVLVCDIYIDHGKLYQGELGDIESCTYAFPAPADAFAKTRSDWKDKPEGVKIRWM